MRSLQSFTKSAILASAAATAVGMIGVSTARADVQFQTFDTDLQGCGVWWNDAAIAWDSSMGNPTAGSMAVLSATPSESNEEARDVLAWWQGGSSTVNTANLNSYANVRFDVYVPTSYVSPELNLWVAFGGNGAPAGDWFAETVNRVGNVSLALRDQWQEVVLPVPAGVPTTGNTNFQYIFGNPGTASGGGVAGDLFWIDNIRLTDYIAVFTNAEWGVDADGSWTTGTNWVGGTAPAGADHTALFGSTATAPRTVTVDAPTAVGSITFDNSNSYTLSGSNTITLSSAGSMSAVNVLSGSHTIATPLTTTNNPVVMNVAAGGTLNLTGQISVPQVWYSFKKEGAGLLQIENLRNHGLEIQEGTVRVSAKATANDPSGTSFLYWRFIDTDAALDLTNNSMILNYDAPGPNATLEDEVRTDLFAGKIMSSSAGAGLKLGYGDNAALGQTDFAGQVPDADCILIKFTYAGDANLDGQVTISDLGDLASNWQSTTAVWRNGDFNYDGAVTISDLGDLASNWQAGVGSPLGMSFAEALAAVGLGGAQVPEPATMGLLSLSLMGLAKRRRN